MSAFNADSASVHKYLDILQGVINRMAANCTGCKTWCLTLVSATVVIVADKSQPEYVWIAFAPLLLFCCLDAYYLTLERSFRNRYNAFVDKLHAGQVRVSDLYLRIPFYPLFPVNLDEISVADAVPHVVYDMYQHLPAEGVIKS